jgi:hypothetical protein
MWNLVPLDVVQLSHGQSGVAVGKLDAVPQVAGGRVLRIVVGESRIPPLPRSKGTTSEAVGVITAGIKRCGRGRSSSVLVGA